MSTGSSISTTPMAPSTRTSATPGSARSGSSPARSPASMRGTSARHRPSAMMSRFSEAMAHASGLAMKVGPCIRPPPSPAEIAAATSRVVSVAASDRNPPVNALPTHRTSGVTAAAAVANRSPVRPKPVAISSAMSSSPCRSQISRSPTSSSWSWKRMPPAPWTTGSTITAATESSTSDSNSARYAARTCSDDPRGGGTGAKTCGVNVPAHRECMPPSGSQTLIGARVSPW